MTSNALSDPTLPKLRIAPKAPATKHPISPDVAGVTSTATTKPGTPGTIYTCPMHPQIRQVGPGSCPICGMTLELVDPTADTGTNPELVDMRRRFWIGVPLALVVLVLAMGHDIRGLAAIANTSWLISGPGWNAWPFHMCSVFDCSK